jgi:DNA replication initiation complex subunit (GINS family)
MAAEAIEFGEVSNVYRLERERKGELVKVPDDFFERLRAHITELRRQAGVEESQSAGSKKALLLIEDVKKLSVMLDQIVDCRERKILLIAQRRGDLSKAHLTPSERELVARVQETLDGHRARLEGRHEPGKVCRPAVTGVAMDIKAAPAAGGDFAVLQVLEDVGEFATAESDYHLRKADVVSLPREFAKVLVQQGKAKEIIVAQ